MASMRMIVRRLACAVLFTGMVCGGAQAQTTAWPVKVVVVTTYEEGADTGDAPGELQLWAEREPLTERIDFPGGVHPLLTNKDHSIVVMLSGIGLVNSGASVMALAADKRFDVRKAYWLVAGIAGTDPQVGSIGDAAWADYVVNDFAKSIDMREAPADWPYGIYPMGAKKPGELPAGQTSFGAFDLYAEVFPLDPGLVHWAYATTKDVKLDYPPELRADRANWATYPLAGQPPKVYVGASASSNYYWHGEYGLRWARDWVKMFTAGKSRFAMANTEDASIAEAMARLGRMGAVDAKRLLILRTASNYVIAHKGQTNAVSVSAPYPGMGMPAFEAAYRVGSKVAHELADHWDIYADRIPSAP